jgi:protein gp37
MGDLFHDAVADDVLRSVFLRAYACYRHKFLFLTKRPKRMAEFVGQIGLPLPDNIWLGVTAETQYLADARIPILLSIPAAAHFVSVETMRVEMSLENQT